MDDKKQQKTIEFILNSQVRFYADLQQLQETQKEAEKRVNIFERVCLNLYNTTVEQGKNIAELRESQKETDKHLRETDVRLNAVILMAEKFFSRNNGDSEKKQ